MFASVKNIFVLKRVEL